MKKIMIVMFVVLQSLTAQTPFTLEGITSVNLLFKNPSAIIDKTSEIKIKQKVLETLAKAGIKSPSDRVSTFGIMINGEKKDQTYFIHIKMMVGEEVITRRKGDVPTFALTYFMDDFIESEDPNSDVYESVVEFLLREFIEQYKEENEA